MGAKLAGVLSLMMLVLCGAFYWYYNDAQQRIAILNQNNAKLETAAQLSEQTISSLQRDFAAVNEELKTVNNEFSNIRKQNRVLADKLAEHDLGVLGAARPDSVARVVTNASRKAGRCFEILSGAELTESEKNAENGQQFNSECPWLWVDTSSP